MSLSILIVGGGTIGGHIATSLRDAGHKVRVVEIDPRHVAALDARLGRGHVVQGSGTDAAVLENAGIRVVDVVAAVTGADETNVVVSSLARFEFGVPRVIARVVDPRNAWMFASDMGVDAALNQGDLLAHLVAEELSLGEMTTLLKLRRGQFSLVEKEVAPDAAAVGRRLVDLDLPEQCVIVAVIREGDLHAAHGQLAFESGDEVLAVVHADHTLLLARVLGEPVG